MKKISWLLLFLGVAGLIAVRVFETTIFYDPFIAFFKVAYTGEKFANFDWSWLILSHLFRFLLNLTFSLIIIFALFKNKKRVIQALVVLLAVFSFTFVIYLYCLKTQFEVGYLFSFYMRRFVIQPLLLLIIIPLFYYQEERLK